ncbi:MAG: CNNM domain-containing protein [Phycisphaerales bacterium JB040]
MTLLLVYLTIAIGVSFLCSLCEAALLTLSVSDARVMENAGKSAGRHLSRMKASIDRPLAAILTLNTISHTVGAAGVGAQAYDLWGDRWVGLTSAVLTLLILVASEIVPKSIGASRARALATPVTYLTLLMIWTTLPAVWALNLISNMLKGKSSHESMTREQLMVLAEMATAGGILDKSEAESLQNLLRLREVTVEEVMTPHTVVFALGADDTCGGTLAGHGRLRFSRIPVRKTGSDEFLGVALKSDLYESVIRGRPDRRLGDMTRPMHYVPETASLNSVLQEFARTGHHLYGVVDEHGTFVGLVSLEDVFESIIGAEIVDETDPVADMRDLAGVSDSRDDEDSDTPTEEPI